MPLLLIASILVIFQNPGLAQSAAIRVENLIHDEMVERRIPGVQVAVVRGGKIVLSRSFGVADIQHSVGVTAGTVFPIYSCTKAFTGVAIMQLVEEGKVELSAPVSRYLDGLPPAWQAITIRQLLTHVSGLPNILNLLDPVTYGVPHGTNEEQIWTKLKTLPVNPPGERFSYNQTNYYLLGKVIEKVTGEPFTQVFEERQFKIAGLQNTGFGDAQTTYRYVNNKLVKDYAEFPPFRRTASGMNSTAEDLARWIIALQRGKLLKTKSALETLWTAGTFNNKQPTLWAIGWMAKPRPRHRAVAATGGSRAAFFVYPEDDLAVVVLTNLAGAFPDDFIDELAGYYKSDTAASDPVTALRMELRKRGYEHAIDVYHELKRKDAQFQPHENDLNDWAYRLMNGGGKPKAALEIFKLNVFLYPNSANVYDSVAEAYAVNGNRELAIKNYKRSLELDPKNTNAAQQLKKFAP